MGTLICLHCLRPILPTELMVGDMHDYCHRAAWEDLEHREIERLREALALLREENAGLRSQLHKTTTQRV